MGKVSALTVPHAERRALARLLIKFLSRVGNQRTLDRFVALLLAPSEVVMLGRRLLVAERLRAGKGLDAIARELHVGQATIERVRRWVRAEDSRRGR